ncbi:hypothetical protein ABIA39_008497 [Nocardia sp. GAS34]|uniref:hypothetical protein n=1 Tax=unclassified Nocardia TaxID=2637762 RepID=UPI003D2033D6
MNPAYRSGVEVSPRPLEADVVVCVHLHSHTLHLWYVACESAARRFARNWTAAHLPDYVTVENGSLSNLGRLPDERLWIVP